MLRTIGCILVCLLAVRAQAGETLRYRLDQYEVRLVFKPLGATANDIKREYGAVAVYPAGYFNELPTINGKVVNNGYRTPTRPYCAADLLVLSGKHQQSYRKDLHRPIIHLDRKRSCAEILSSTTELEPRITPFSDAFAGNNTMPRPKQRAIRPFVGITKGAYGVSILFLGKVEGTSAEATRKRTHVQHEWGIHDLVWIDGGSAARDDLPRPFHLVVRQKKSLPTKKDTLGRKA